MSMIDPAGRLGQDIPAFNPHRDARGVLSSSMTGGKSPEVAEAPVVISETSDGW
jgi:hypothetical protein